MLEIKFSHAYAFSTHSSDGLNCTLDEYFSLICLPEKYYNDVMEIKDLHAAPGNA